MSIKRSAERLLGVNHGEWTVLGLFFLLYFLNAFGACIGLNAGESLFIEAYGVQNIPVIFPLTSIFIILITFGLSYLANRFRVTRYVCAVFAVLAALLGLTYFCLVTRPAQALFTGILFVCAYAFFVITKTLLFDLSDAFLDLRQSKRLFPIFSSGTVLGLASAGLLTGRLLGLVKRSVHLVPVWIGFVVLAGLTAALLLRHGRAPATDEPDAADGPSHPLREVMEAIIFQFRSLRRSRLLFYIAVVSFATAFVVVHFDFIYMSAVKAQYGDADKVTRIFGQVRGYSTLIAFTLQFFVTAFLIRTMGLTQVLFIFPVFFACIYGFAFFRMSFVAVIIGRFGYYVTKEAFHFPALLPLFNALSDNVRKYANALINNIIAQLGIVAAGLFLALFVKSGILTVHASIPVAAVLLILMLALMIVVRKEYVRELLANIKNQSPRQLDLLEAVKGLKGSEALASMREILRGQDRDLILFVIESLKNLGSDEADPDIIALLAAHDDPLIVSRALEYFRGEFRPDVIAALDDVLVFDNPETKLHLLDYLAPFYPDPADRSAGCVAPFIARLFEDADPCVRMKAAGILVRAGAAETRSGAGDYISRELDAASPADALALIRSLLTGATGFVVDRILAQGDKYSNASDADRRLAHSYAEILARFPVPRSLARILSMVTADETCLGIVRAKLVSVHIPEECHAYADALLGLHTADVEPSEEEALIRLLLFLRHLPADAEARLLEAMFATRRTSRIHFQIAAKLPYLDTRPDEALDARLSAWVAREIEGMQECLLAQRAFREEDARFSNIFHDETGRLMAARQEAVLSVIRYQYADHQMDVAVSGLGSANPRLRASAIETIENILPRKIAEVLVPFIEGDLDRAIEQSREQQPAFDLERLLGEWINSDIAWYVCLAIHLAAECGLKGLRELIRRKETESVLAAELREGYLRAAG